MSERIRQLAEQATTIVDTVNSQGYSSSYAKFDREKFAELIIGHAIECVRDVLRDEDSDLTYAAASQVQNRIKQHFGVEE